MSPAYGDALEGIEYHDVYPICITETCNAQCPQSPLFYPLFLHCSQAAQCFPGTATLQTHPSPPEEGLGTRPHCWQHHASHHCSCLLLQLSAAKSHLRDWLCLKYQIHLESPAKNSGGFLVEGVVHSLVLFRK